MLLYSFYLQQQYVVFLLYCNSHFWMLTRAPNCFVHMRPTLNSPVFFIPRCGFFWDHLGPKEPWGVKNRRPLLEQQGFPSDEQHQLVLLDDAADPLRRPSLQNMRQAIRWLTHNVQTGQRWIQVQKHIKDQSIRLLLHNPRERERDERQ